MSILRDDSLPTFAEVVYTEMRGLDGVRRPVRYILLPILTAESRMRPCRHLVKFGPSRSATFSSFQILCVTFWGHAQTALKANVGREEAMIKTPKWGMSCLNHVRTPITQDAPVRNHRHFLWCWRRNLTWTSESWIYIRGHHTSTTFRSGSSFFIPPFYVQIILQYFYPCSWFPAQHQMVFNQVLFMCFWNLCEYLMFSVMLQKYSRLWSRFVQQCLENVGLRKLWKHKKR